MCGGCVGNGGADVVIDVGGVLDAAGTATCRSRRDASM